MFKYYNIVKKHDSWTTYAIQLSLQIDSSMRSSPPPYSKPATQAVIKQAKLAVIMALRTTADKSAVRCGAIAVNAPKMMPMEPKLAKPQRAYVVITSDRWSRKSGDSVKLDPLMMTSLPLSAVLSRI